MPSAGFNPLATCTSIGPQCPVDATVLSYRPNLGANTFFLSIFGLCSIFQLILGIRFKTWTFMLALVLGCITEVIGYVGRVMLSINPWSTIGFEVQIISLIIAPVFVAAGVYLTLKHLVLEFGTQYSILRPAKLYTWIFISADIFSLILQGAGGALSASGSSPGIEQTGTDIALAGIIFQVVSLANFGVLFTIYFVRVYMDRGQQSEHATRTAQSTGFRWFFAAVILAFTTILVRCIYRIPELGGRFRNSVFRDQTDFMVLDGGMIAIAVLALTIAHPGFCFGGLSKGKRIDEEKA